MVPRIFSFLYLLLEIHCETVPPLYKIIRRTPLRGKYGLILWKAQKLKTITLKILEKYVKSLEWFA